MPIQSSVDIFFKAGGTLDPETPSYIMRAADETLLHQLLTRQFCYVLTSRQHGKSSLMIRTARRLNDQGIRTAIIDLSSLGTLVTIDQWYLGIIKYLVQELQIIVDPEQWWSIHHSLGPVQRFIDFLHDVLLANIAEPVIIFFDEIDSTIEIAFSDDFFASIRALYNFRATNIEYERLTFVLLGVATPTDLIKDRSRTPFNIGYAVELHEFNRSDLLPLEVKLETLFPGRGTVILNRIFFWTNGHPYLTQRLCLEIASLLENDWQDNKIDYLVDKIFISSDEEREPNIQFVLSSINGSSIKRQLLQLYQKVYQDKIIFSNDRSLIQSRLRLIGIVRVEHNQLQVSNQIYHHIFDLRWIKNNMPINWFSIITGIATTISIIVIVSTIFLIHLNTEQERISRINNLAQLCDRRIGAVDQAQNRFIEFSPKSQIDLFQNDKDIKVQKHIATVAKCLYPKVNEMIKDKQQQAILLNVMCCVIVHDSFNPSTQTLKSNCQCLPDRSK